MLIPSENERSVRMVMAMRMDEDVGSYPFMHIGTSSLILQQSQRLGLLLAHTRGTPCLSRYSICRKCDNTTFPTPFDKMQHRH